MISEFPLFIFTTFAGLGAGAYAVNAAFPFDSRLKKPWLFPLVCLILVGVGLLGALGHVGRPEMFMYALLNPSAMIAQEAYWSGGLCVIMLIDVLVAAMKGAQVRPLRIVGAVVGLILMCIMGWAYFTSYGVSAWTSVVTLPLFVVGDLAAGAALVAIFEADLLGKKAFKGTFGVLGVLAVVTFAALCAPFASTGESVVPFVVAAVVEAAGVAAGVCGAKLKLDNKKAALVAFACIFVATVVARYAFYAAATF